MTDILTDPLTGDVLCQDGDFMLGDATYQHQADLLQAQEGEYKQFPATGVGLPQFLNDEDPADMIRKIRAQFKRDGIAIEKIAAGATLRITATYK